MKSEQIILSSDIIYQAASRVEELQSEPVGKERLFLQQAGVVKPNVFDLQSEPQLSP